MVELLKKKRKKKWIHKKTCTMQHLGRVDVDSHKSSTSWVPFLHGPNLMPLSQFPFSETDQKFKGLVVTSQRAQFPHWPHPYLLFLGGALKWRLHQFVNSWYWPSCIYLIRFPFIRLGLLAAHCYASCSAACCGTADSMCFHIDYTSGISADANAWVCVCERVFVQRALVRSE